MSAAARDPFSEMLRGLVEEACEPPVPPAGRVMTEYQKDPLGFIKDVLGVRLWKRQKDIALAIAASRTARVAVKSGHKVGKTRLMVCIAIWFVCCFEQARCFMTNASGRQVRDVQWTEVSKLWRQLSTEHRRIIGGTLHKVPDAGWVWDDGRELKGFTTDDPERMAGYSGVNMMFLLDEASGIAAPIFQAIEGNRAAGVRVLMTSNPTQTSGEFFEAFHSKRQFYTCFTVSSAETPNVTGEEEPIPGLAGADWIAERKLEWGEDSPYYQIRVKGEFATQSSNAVVALVDVDAAQVRWAKLPRAGGFPGAALGQPAFEPELGRLNLGVDVARFGDDESVIKPRRGTVAMAARVVHGMDTVALTGMVIATVKELRRPGEPKALVKVDGIGVGGGVVDQLRGHPDIEVVDVNVSEVSDAPEDFPNKRSQLWFALGDWMKTGAVPPDEKLAGEAVAPTYSFDARGRRKVVEKSEMKKKLGRSPDRAEALMLAIYTPPAKPEPTRGVVTTPFMPFG